MAFSLRPYQTDVINQTRAALREASSVLIVSPTGSGKTALTASMAGTAAGRGFGVGFGVHRQELIEQTAITFAKVGIDFGIIAAGFTPRPQSKVQIFSVDTLKRRLDSTVPFDLLIWDECHHLAAAGWEKIATHFGSAKQVGLTATPVRLDGKGLGKYFNKMVMGPRVQWLIDNGYLTPFKIFAPYTPDMSGIGKSMGDFAKGATAKMMDKPSITGDAIQHYRRHAIDKQGISFCVSIEHSKHVAEQYKANGIWAEHLDGEMDKKERRRLMQAFRDKKIQVLTNVDLFGEGVDVPGIEVVQMLRPTHSLSLYLQQCGRSCRPAEGKTHALILDHAGNVMRHGLPEEDREWSLEGREPKKGKPRDDEDLIKLKLCPQCFHTHRPAPRCPSCGHVYETQARIIQEREGDLVEIDAAAIVAARRQRKIEEWRCKTEAEFITLGMMRKYQDPEGWARNMMRVRAEQEKKINRHG